MRKLFVNLIPDELDVDTRLGLIQNAGFEGVFTHWNPTDRNAAYANAIRAHGLIYSAVHIPCDGLDVIWEDAGDIGETKNNTLIACLEDAARQEVPLVFLHAMDGMEKCTPTELGLERYGKILRRGTELGVRVAMENAEAPLYLDAIMKTYADEPCLGFCIDTGHEICYTRGYDMIGRYGTYLAATHINDNLGQTGEKIEFMDDLHLLPFDGKVDFPGVINRLQKVGYTGDLTFELKRQKRRGERVMPYKDLTFDEYIHRAYERAVQFRDMLDRR